jgi:TonB family protein
MAPGMGVSEESYEVAVRWGDRLIEVRLLSAAGRATWAQLSSGAAALFAGEGQRDAPLLISAAGETRLTHPSAQRTVKLDEAGAASVQQGMFTLSVRRVQRPAAARRSLWRDVDFSFFKLASITGLGAAALLLMLLLPPTVDAATDPFFFRRPLTVSEAFAPPPPRVVPTFEEPKVTPVESDRVRSPGAAGPQRAQKPSGGASERPGLLGSLNSEGMRTLLQGGGLDRAVNMLGKVQGPSGAVAERGTGGFLSRGNGPGGDGPGTSIGGPLGTLGRPGGGDGISSGLARKGPAVVPQSPKVLGPGMDRAEIARVIRQHQAAIRACYETGLHQAPDLEGKVAVTFVIDGSGAVASVQVAESSLEHPGVEACMLQRIGSWRFPEPRGGGQVTVNFPWIFRPAGGE